MKSKTPVLDKRLELLSFIGDDGCILAFGESEHAWNSLIKAIGGGYAAIPCTPLPKGKKAKFATVPRDLYVVRCVS